MIMEKPTMKQTIIQNMGLDRIRARVPQWHAALMAGRAAAPRCTATTRAGEPCRRERMKGSDKCPSHLHGAARDTVNNRLAREAMGRLRSTNAIHRQRGTATLVD